MRAFIALDLPAELRSELGAVSARLQRQLAGAPTVRTRLRWAPPENMHLTLKFLGELAAEQTPAVISALQHIAADFAPIQVHLDGLGVFPNPRRPRVLWAGLAAPPALQELYLRVEDALSALGFPAEARGFTPHLTLARARQDAAPGQLAGVAGALAAERMQPLQAVLDEIVLFQSQLKPGGAVYNPLARLPLSAAKE